MQPKIFKRHLFIFIRSLFLVVTLFTLIGANVLTVFALDTGYFSPAIASTPGKSWTNVSYSFASDNFYATSKRSNKQLKLSRFNIPGIAGGAIINGVEVSVEGYTNGLQANVALSYNAGSNFTTAYTTTLTGTETTTVLGGPTNTWGRTWNASDFTNANFMVKLTTAGSGEPLYIDHVQVKVYVTPPATTIVLSPVSGPYAGTASMSATLTSTASGDTISSANIKFYVGGNGVNSNGECTGSFAGNATTNGSGIATLASADLSNINAGNYPYGACAQFDGDLSYQATSITSSLTVLGTATQLVASPVSGTYGGTVSLSATLTNNGTAVNGQWVTFYLFGNVLSSKQTNGSGVATLSNVSLEGYNAGTSNDIGASFEGDGNLSPSNASALITINPRPIEVTAVKDTKIYDGTNSSSAVPTLSGGSIVTGDITAFTQTFDTKDVGTGKTLTPVGTVEDENSGQNYVVTTVPVTTGVINKASLTVIADSKKIFVTRPDPVFTYSYTGFVGGDTGAVVDTKPICTVSVVHTAVGTYPIICSGAADNNYKFSYINSTLIVAPPTFSDVPTNYWAWQYVEGLYAAGVTGGCGNGIYCPTGTVTRDQMAIFLLKGRHGSGYVPPAVGGTTGFNDVPTNHWAAAWIKQLAAEGITGGCGGGNYCPGTAVTRDQMAIFLLKAKHGTSYSPPPPTGVFVDVPTNYWAAAWIERLAAESITGGCGSGNYCPGTAVTRDQMAVFLVRTFGLATP